MGVSSSTGHLGPGDQPAYVIPILFDYSTLDVENNQQHLFNAISFLWMDMDSSTDLYQHPKTPEEFNAASTKWNKKISDRIPGQKESLNLDNYANISILLKILEALPDKGWPGKLALQTRAHEMLAKLQPLMKAVNVTEQETMAFTEAAGALSRYYTKFVTTMTESTPSDLVFITIHRIIDKLDNMQKGSRQHSAVVGFKYLLLDATFRATRYLADSSPHLNEKLLYDYDKIASFVLNTGQFLSRLRSDSPQTIMATIRRMADYLVTEWSSKAAGILAKRLGPGMAWIEERLPKNPVAVMEYTVRFGKLSPDQAARALYTSKVEKNYKNLPQDFANAMVMVIEGDVIDKIQQLDGLMTSSTTEAVTSCLASFSDPEQNLDPSFTERFTSDTGGTESFLAQYRIDREASRTLLDATGTRNKAIIALAEKSCGLINAHLLKSQKLFF